MLNNPMFQMINMIKSAHNPQALMQQMLGSNPKYGQIMQLVQGKSPQQIEEYVRNMYKNQNIDINQIANQYGFKI